MQSENSIHDSSRFDVVLGRQLGCACALQYLLDNVGLELQDVLPP